MKIGIVLSSVPGYSETFFYSKINGLRERGHKVVLFAHGAVNERLKGVKLVNPHVVDRRLVIMQLVRMSFVLVRLLLLHPVVLKRFYKLESQDGRSFSKILERAYLSAHILSSSVDWLDFGFATMALGKENAAKAIGAKMAVSFRGYDVAIYPLKFPGCYHHLWEKVDKVHTISDDLVDLALQLGMPSSTNVVKITPAIDYKKFANPGKNGELGRCLKILTVGRLHWKKGIEYSLLALSELKKQGLEFEYNLAGDGPEMERLKFAAFQLNVSENVRFLGKVSHDEVAKLMEGSDIYLQPSVQEGFCNAVLEAQATGLLCVVSNAEGLPENVLDGRTGWVVPKRDPDALAAKLTEIASMDAKERAYIVECAQKRIEAEFGLSLQLDKIEAFYS